ncbi:MAG: HAD-IA family hydrolase [Planctomycetota bacterium]|nr:HAD-IA family hydrolase [Planctomycetota bacterium]
MSLKAVFLDVGNTLICEQPSRFAIYAEAAQRRGVMLTPDEMRLLMVRAHAELPQEHEGDYRYSDGWFRIYLRRIFHEHLSLPEKELEAIATELFGRFEDPATFQPFPGAHELLDDLRARGLALGVISNWSARLPKLLRRLDFDRRLDVVMCSAIERMEKPEPEIFAAALERVGCRPDEALHAGDDLVKDARGAAAAGLEAILVDHFGALHPERGETDGYPVVTNLASLEDLILNRP